jgi:hypothetical protein
MRARRAETPERQGNSSIVALARRGLGAVGHSGIVPYGARSPAPACGGHAQTRQFHAVEVRSGSLAVAKLEIILILIQRRWRSTFRT